MSAELKEAIYWVENNCAAVILGRANALHVAKTLADELSRLRTYVAQRAPLTLVAFDRGDSDA